MGDPHVPITHQCPPLPPPTIFNHSFSSSAPTSRPSVNSVQVRPSKTASGHAASPHFFARGFAALVTFCLFWTFWTLSHPTLSSIPLFATFAADTSSNCSRVLFAIDQLLIRSFCCLFSSALCLVGCYPHTGDYEKIDH